MNYLLHTQQFLPYPLLGLQVLIILEID